MGVRGVARGPVFCMKNKKGIFSSAWTEPAVWWVEQEFTTVSLLMRGLFRFKAGGSDCGLTWWKRDIIL